MKDSGFIPYFSIVSPLIYSPNNLLNCPPHYATVIADL